MDSDASTFPLGPSIMIESLELVEQVENTID